MVAAQKGLPLTETTIDNLEEEFQKHGKVLAVRLRRHLDTKAFKVCYCRILLAFARA
jgi:hypothetical protein